MQWSLDKKWQGKLSEKQKMVLDSLILVGYVWLMLAMWQLLAWGWWGGNKEKGGDGGWAMGRIGIWIVMSLIIWWLSHLGLAINTQAGVWGIMASLTVGGVMGFVKKRKKIKKMVVTRWKIILAEEILFAIGLIGLTMIRGFNPKILDLEKFMDAGFINMYLRSPTLPAIDIWLAGEKVNYYTFGHFMGSVMLRSLGIKIDYGYNLLLGIIMGLTMMLSFAVVVNLMTTKKRVVGAGVLGSLLVTVAGNSQTIWFWLKNKNFVGYWYADATRFIENTIHEFPSYSFVVSDLHAHVWDVPIVLLSLIVLEGWLKTKKRTEKRRKILVFGGLLGVMAMTNSWDVLVYGTVFGLVEIIELFRKKITLIEAVENGLIVIVALVIISAAWWCNFVNIGQGVKWVKEGSSIKELLILWTSHLILVLGAIVMAVKEISKRRSWESSLVLAMGLAAIVLILIPEIIYVKDIYPSHPRANTMFKLTYQAFILMGLIGSWWAGQMLNKKTMMARLGMGIIVIVIAGLMLFPYFGYRDYYQGLKKFYGLDGLWWLRVENLNDYQGIEWLRENSNNGEVIVEAVGESYTKYARVSVFSGLPTILGWRVHEWLWRGGFEIPALRTEEVRKIYEFPDSQESDELLKKYEVRYVFVGKTERDSYQLDLQGVRSLGEVVFRDGMCEIVRI